MNSPTGQTRRRIFTLDGSNDADSRKDVPFGGFVDIAPHFRGEIPENPNFWGVNIETDRDRQELVVGGPNRRPTTPRWRTAAIWKKTVKSLYFCNRSTDFNKIWYNDAYWPPTADRPLQFRISENPKWRRPPS